MRRQFDNESYHLDLNESFMSRYGNYKTVLFFLFAISMLFLVTVSFRNDEPGPQSQPGGQTSIPPSISKIDLDKFDPKSELSKYSRSDLELIIRHLGDIHGKNIKNGNTYSTYSSDSKTKNEPQDDADTSSTQPISTPVLNPTPPQPPTPTPSVNQPPLHQGPPKETIKDGTNGNPIPIPALFEGHEIVVTLTTIPDRMKYLNATLLSLVSQTVPPTEIVMNIPYVSRRFFNEDGTPLAYDLPIDFIRYINALGSLDDPAMRNSDVFPWEMPHLSRIPKITIHRCDDDGPATKLLPTLAREFAIGRMDSILMIADDDVIYPPNWVESLVGYYLSSPELHYSAVGARGYCAPPTNVWEWSIISQIAISGTQLLNITENLNHPYRFDPITNQLQPHFGSAHPDDRRSLVTPNAHRFIWRPQNYTIVEQSGGRPIRDENVTPPTISTKVTLNPDWPFAHLFDEKHPMYKPNKWHRHQTSDVEGTLSDVEQFVQKELEFPHLYTPISQIGFKTILPHVPHKKESMAHTPVDVITGNNGFLLRPYYFLRYSPFIGNITRFEPQVLNSVTLEHYLKKGREFEYTTHNSYFGKAKPYLKTEFLKVAEIVADKVDYIREMREKLVVEHRAKWEKEKEKERGIEAGKKIEAGQKAPEGNESTQNPQNAQNAQNAQKSDPTEYQEPTFDIEMDSFWQVHGALSRYQVALMKILEQGADIRVNQRAAEETKLRAILAKNNMLKPDQPSTIPSHLPSGHKPKIPAKYIPGAIDKHEHPELNGLSGTQYHMEHRKLHQKLDALDELSYKFSRIFDLNSLDLPLQHQELTAKASNIVKFGRFYDDLDAVEDSIMHNPKWTPPPNQFSAFDFGKETKTQSVPGSDLSEILPESVYYMDDIWFNGILAANDVSRVVTTLTVDPLHRPKMQEATTTLEQVPIGRSFHNNVLLKLFEQHWTNCPYVPANLTIPDWYLKYFAFSNTSFEERAQEAIQMLNRRGKKAKQYNNDANTTTTSSASSPATTDWASEKDDYRNTLSNPWAEWGVPDNETNVASKYYRMGPVPDLGLLPPAIVRNDNKVHSWGVKDSSLSEGQTPPAVINGANVGDVLRNFKPDDEAINRKDKMNNKSGKKTEAEAETEAAKRSQKKTEF